MSKLSKREKWAKETGMAKEQYKSRKSLPMPVKNKGLAINQSERPKGVSKREFWAEKSGFTKEQYKDRASLPAIKPQPKRYSGGGGGSTSLSTSSSSQKAGILANYAKAFSERVAQGAQQFTESLKPALRTMAGKEPYTPKELIHMRRDWRRSDQPVNEKLTQVKNITKEIHRISQAKQIKRQEIIQKTQDQIKAENDDPQVQFGRFIMHVQADPIGTVKKVWNGEYDKPKPTAPISTPVFGYTEHGMPSVNAGSLSKYLGKPLGGALSTAFNAVPEAAEETIKSWDDWRNSAKNNERPTQQVAKRANFLVRIAGDIVTPFSAAFNTLEQLALPEEMKNKNPVYLMVKDKIKKSGLSQASPTLEKFADDVASTIIGLDPMSAVKAFNDTLALGGKGLAYYADRALDKAPIDAQAKEDLRPALRNAAEFLGQAIVGVGAFELGLGKKGAKPMEEMAGRVIEGKPTMADITREGRSREVLLHPELREQLGRPKIEEIKRVPVKEPPKTEKPISIDDIIKESKYVEAVEKPKVTTVTGSPAAGKARFDFQTNTGQIVLTPDQSALSRAHEYGHVMNFVLGENEKLSNRLNEALSGKFEATGAITKFAKENKLDLPTSEAAKLMKKQVAEAAKIDKPDGYQFSNASEEFAHAVANAIVNESKASAVAPEWTKFIRQEAIPEKLMKTEKPAPPKAEKPAQFTKPYKSPFEKKVRETRAKAQPETKTYTKPKEEKVVVLPEQKEQTAKEYLRSKSKTTRFRERTARGANLQREYKRLREHLRMQEERGAGFFAKRSTIKAMRAIENEMSRHRRSREKYRLAVQKDLTTKLLRKLEGRKEVSKQFIQDLTNSPDLKQVEKDVIREVLSHEGDRVDVKKFTEKVKAELLPLTMKSSDSGIRGGDKYNPKKTIGAPRYENISLPDRIRGNVANYSEHIYESPIKTSAGDTHFGGGAGSSGNVPNYFGHVRVEDMVDNVSGFKKTGKDYDGNIKYKPTGKSDTRRVIEVQSDLYQKGNLDREIRNAEGYDDLLKRGIVKKKLDQASRQQIRKLEQYNNPTAHFRMVREEVKRAAKDGKTKLQFPTGETAMKIEGLGGNANWYDSETWKKYQDTGDSRLERETLSNESIEVGKRVVRANTNGMEENWVITDVTDAALGQFEAVPEYTMDGAIEMINKTGEKGTIEKVLARGMVDRAKEEFSLAEGLDKNDPIYRFYEKDLGRYLKNRYNAERVTDSQGVTWYEVDIKPEMAKEPIEAFRLKDDFEAATGIKLTDKQEAEIQQLNKRIFGDEDVKITAQILTPEGQKALGAYKDKIIKILDGQADPKGTFYHEAVHKYLEQFLTLDEQADLLDLARKEFKTKDFTGAEEMLAEKFIEYAKSREGVTGAIKAHFDRIIQRIKRFFGSEDQIKSFYNEVILGKKAKQGVLAQAVKKARAPRMAKPSWAGGESPLTYREPTTTPIRMDKLNTTEAVKDTIAKITLADSKRIGFQRRGKMTMAEIKDLADMTNMNAKDVMNAKAGSIVNAENAYAVRKLMVTVASELSDYARSLPKEITAEQRTEFKAKLNAFRKIQNTLAGIRTETGRALRQFREEVLPEEYDILDELITEVKKIDATEGDQIQKAVKIANEVKPEGMYRKAVRALVAARTAWMLYKPTTHAANIMGGVWKALTLPITRKFAETISPYVKGGGDGVAKGEARAFIEGMKDSTPEAWKTFKSELKNIGLLREVELDAVKSHELPRKRDIQEFLQSIKLPEKAADKIDKAITISYQYLTAADKFFKTVLGTGEMYSLAMRKAANEGLTGQAYVKRILSLIEDPSQDKAFLDAINTNTKEALFQENTALTRKVNSFMRDYPEARIISPFVMTPSNIALDAVRTSPLGFLRPAYKRGRFGEEMGNAEKSLAYGQAALGSALAATAVILAAKNRLTLVQPRDTSKEEFYAGKQSYSIRIGDKYIQFRRIDPLASIITNAANAYNILAKGESGYGAKALALQVMFARNIMDQTFTSGVSDMFDALSGIEVDSNGNTTFNAAAKRFLTSLGTSIIPYQSFLAGVTAATDKTLREKESFADSVKSLLPGYSKTLPATIDIFGNAVVDERGALSRFLSPFKVKTEPNNPLLKELEASAYNLTTLQLDKIGNYTLSGKAKEYWMRIVGKETERRLNALIQSDTYKNLDQQGRDDLLRKEVTDLRGEYRDLMKNELKGSSQENQMNALKTVFPDQVNQIEKGQDPASTAEIELVEPTIHKETEQGNQIKWQKEHPDKTRREFKDHYEAIDYWKPYIDAAADDAKVPRYLMYALMSQESGGDPQAQNPKSSAGGLFQFIDSTWKYVTKKYGGEELPIEKKYDPETNAHYAALYLKELVKTKHTYKKALAAYGEGAAYADKILARQKEIEDYYRKKREEASQQPSSVLNDYIGSISQQAEIQKMIDTGEMQATFWDFLFGERASNPKFREADIDKYVQKFVSEQYPLTDEMKKIMQNTPMYSQPQDQLSASHAGSYFPGKSEDEEKKMSLANPTGFTETYGASAIMSPNAPAHELLHAFLMKHGSDKNAAWVNEFNRAWDAEKKNNVLMQYIDDNLDTNSAYSGIEEKKDWKANERFAYLGDKLGREGLNNIPKPMRKYYSDVFSETWTPQQRKLADRLDKKIQRIWDTSQDRGHITQKDSKKLDILYKRISKVTSEDINLSDYIKRLRNYSAKRRGG